MSDLGLTGHAPRPPRKARGLRRWTLRLAASRPFQSWAARFPLTRGITRREGEAMLDLAAGFVHSQCLLALVELDILPRLMEADQTAAQLALSCGVPEPRLTVLLNAAEALGLLASSGGAYRPTRRGAALTGVPGLADMIRHHAVLYRDLADPVAFFRGDSDPELARFWPYVFGAGAAGDPETAERYSRLMADSQALVAEETLAVVPLAGRKHLLDVGGGTGAFLTAALTATPGLRGTLFDLPAVVPGARQRFADAGLSGRAEIRAGSFRDDPLPDGADTISLVRVLYDHSDDTVSALLDTIYAALPPGGMVIVSEPMLGAGRPSRAGDAYFAIYTMAMRTGRTRSADQISAALAAAGFSGIRSPRTARPFLTSVVTARRP